jgi:O-antigen ligase
MMAPHNSYMEAMVELGVLGIILFLRMYLLSWRGLERARRKLGERTSISDEQKEQMVFARVLQISLAGNAVAGFFLSMAYATILWVTFGICMAMMALEDRPTEEA